jgi:tetratricopeptide (TPR) repeat protein
MTAMTLLVLGSMVCAAVGKVGVWEEPKVIPTWEVKPAEVNPIFRGRKSGIYPYTYKQILTSNVIDETYKACWLENDFVRVLVLPEIGGRLHGAKDTTNEYNFFYWHPTIKPGLISMTGAWISGGVEWNFPHGHRPTCFSPVSYRLVENDDGSKTVWVGETERIFRMRWIAGMTLYPGKSVIEVKMLLINPTPLQHSFQMWATTAVNANEYYQAIYPTRVVTGHGKHEFKRWPVHEGTDISWWKNIPNFTSYFATEPGDFFGGYDHRKKAGTIITADRYIAPGKKLWSWGSSTFGRMYDSILSDGQGPYFEPQLGVYSDNQPDYHWIEPGEVKSVKFYFYPVRDIGQFKNANVNGALNLEFDGDQVNIGAYSTAILESGTVRLTQNEKIVFEKSLKIDPSKPFVQEVEIDDASQKQESFTLALLDKNGNILVSYSPEVLEELAMPEPLKGFDAPEEIKTTDELWHAGEITYKFRNASRGRLYFEEAIKRDSGNSRSQISLAELDIKKARYKSALEHLAIAEKRDPDNGKLFYLKAVAEEALGDYESAYDHYYRSVYFQSNLSSGYERISQLDLRKSDYTKAVEHINKAIEYDSINPGLWSLKAVALRQEGQTAAAQVAAEHALGLDPLSPLAMNELILVLQKQDKDSEKLESELSNILMGDWHSYIELACDYSSAGLYADAIKVLKKYNIESHPSFVGQADKNVALTSYYAGFMASKMGQAEEAARWFKKGRSQSVDYIFPFRLEAMDVFKEALKLNPKDAEAYYYLGLVYAGLGEFDQTISHYRKSLELDPGNLRAWRNLGLCMVDTKGDLEEARQCYEKALALAPNDSRILMELDRVKQSLGQSGEKRLAFLKERIEIVEGRDELLTDMLDLMVETGHYEETIKYFSEHHFHNWEGRYGIHNSYMDAYMRMARAAESPQKGLEYYLKACEYPLNLAVGPREPNLRGFLYYPMSKLYRQIGDEKEAKRLLKITANETSKRLNIGSYYQALALRDLGQSEKAEQILSDLKAEAEKLIGRGANNAFGYYYLSKVQEANGQMQQAQQNLEKALSINSLAERLAIYRAQVGYAGTNQ